jgi:hypothetical protein
LIYLKDAFENAQILTPQAERKSVPPGPLFSPGRAPSRWKDRFPSIVVLCSPGGAEEGQADRDRGMPELINTADASSPQSLAPDSSPNEAVRTASGSRSAPRSGSKLSKVIELLQGDGATVGELVAFTGWLPHTARAALTGLRERG